MPKYSNYENVNNYSDSIDKTQYVLSIESEDHRKKILNEHKIVCIDLYANWCGPCKNIAPTFNQLAKEYNVPGKCLLVKENVDLELTNECQVISIPTFLFFKNGQILTDQNNSPVKVEGGYIEEIKNILDRLLEHN